MTVSNRNSKKPKQDMSMKQMRRGVPNLLKDGHKQYSGVEAVVLKNIDACKKLSKITRTSLGPNGTRRSAARALWGRHGLPFPVSWHQIPRLTGPPFCMNITSGNHVWGRVSVPGVTSTVVAGQFGVLCWCQFCFHYVFLLSFVLYILSVVFFVLIYNGCRIDWG